MSWRRCYMVSTDTDSNKNAISFFLPSSPVGQIINCQLIEDIILGPMIYNFFVRNLGIFVISQSVCPWRDFQVSLLFASQARAYSSGAPLKTYLQTLDKVVKACQGQTLQLIAKICKNVRIKLYNIGPWVQCYKTDKLFQPSLIFVSTAGAYPSGTHLFSYSLPGQAPGLIHKHQARLEKLTRENALAYLENS